MLFSGSIEMFMQFIQAFSSVMTLFVVSALLYLRWTQPQLKRPYKVIDGMLYWVTFKLTWDESSSELFWSRVVFPSVNFSHFHFLLQNHWTNFNQTWHKASMGDRDSIQVYSNKRPRPFLRGDNNEIDYRHSKKSFSQEPVGQFQSNMAQSILW